MTSPAPLWRDAAIIGAGPSGLAVAACLQEAGLAPVLFERDDAIAPSWKRHYERLALHTARDRSHLPGQPFPKSWPQYVPRADVAEYLDDYAEGHGLAPLLNCEVHEARPVEGGWRLRHGQGETLARTLVLATGFADTPKRPDLPGLADFPGPVLHSRDYRRPADLPGQKVLIIGFGNTGGELAIDLSEAGRDVTLAVRSPVNVLPKELFGQPIGNYDLLQRLLPYRLADKIAAPMLRWKVGALEPLGLRKSAKGPNAQIIEDGQIPLIDLGTIALLRAGKIHARPGVTGFQGATAQFADGQEAAFDAVLLATGYKVDLRRLLPDTAAALDAEGRPLASGSEIATGLWGISYHAVPNGQLREIRRQAPIIAAEIEAYLNR